MDARLLISHLKVAHMIACQRYWQQQEHLTVYRVAYSLIYWMTLIPVWHYIPYDMGNTSVRMQGQTITWFERNSLGTIMLCWEKPRRSCTAICSWGRGHSDETRYTELGMILTPWTVSRCKITQQNCSFVSCTKVSILLRPFVISH